MARIKKWTDESLIEAVKTSKSFTEVCKKLQVNGGSYYASFRKRITELGIDFSHFPGKSWAKGVEAYWLQKPLEFYLVENSSIESSVLKEKLIKAKVFENVCCLCGLGDTWNGKKLVLQLDHINGNNKDNRKENLRILCPNCHTQTETWGSKRLRKPRVTDREPGWRKRPRIHHRKVPRPGKEQLQKDVLELGFSGTGRKYGVSDNAVRKWLR